MITATRKAQYIEHHLIPVDGQSKLHAELMLPRSLQPPMRLVIVAPLVGANASQALIIFRTLTRRGAAVLSFEYRGHARSSGNFELDKTVVDTQYALEWACDYARVRGIPVHGLATCFGTVPLLAQFASGHPVFPLCSISAVSGLFRLDQILRFEDFTSILARHTETALDRTELVEGIARQSLDLREPGVRGAIREYLKGLFPELRVELNRFEELHYERANVARTLSQLSQASYLERLSVPREIPCRFFLGRNDHLLGLDTAEGRRVYRDHVLSLIAHAEFRELEFDHYGRGPDHEAALEGLGDLFEECE